MEDFLKFDHLPVFTLGEVRERVRNGEDCKIGVFSQMLASTYHPDCLHRMREISDTEPLVFLNNNVIARCQAPSSSPLPEGCDSVISRCNQHITEIRNRLDAALRKINVSSNPPPIHPFEKMAMEKRQGNLRLALLGLEHKIRKLRNGFLATYYTEYTHDAFHDDEHYEETAKGVDSIYEIYRETLAEIEKTIKGS